VKLLSEIRTWIDSQASERIYWLNGLAGTGKSTIAASVCEDLDRHQQLCISFFISRKAPDLRSAQKAIHTIACQLAELGSSQSRQAICRALQERPGLLSKSLQEQVSALVTEPLRYTSSLLFVVDALDECETGVRGRGGTDLLSVLANAVCSLAHVKLFVTSRNEVSLRNAFEAINQRSQAQVVQLHEIEKSIVENDIREYLSQSFEKIKRLRADDLSIKQWPSQSEFAELLRRAGVLFVYAATVINFVGEPLDDPVERLKLVLATKADSAGPVFELLDDLYVQVLASVIPREVAHGGIIVSRLRAVLGALVFLQEPLRVRAIAELTGQTMGQAAPLIRCLAAITLGAAEKPISLFHLSFPDFITSRERCRDDRFLLYPSVQHQDLALRCLRVMNNTEQGLRYDICDLVDPFATNKEVTDLDQRLQGVTEAVRYAAVFWAVHLSCGAETDDALNGELVVFCENHLFHWIELLSLLGRLSAVDKYLPGALIWCQVRSSFRACLNRELTSLIHSQKHANSSRILTAERLLRDAWRMYRSYQIPITSHALHVYHSALATMPECQLQRHGHLEQSSIPRLISPRQSNWGPDVRILEGHSEQVGSAAFSRDGQQIVSCSEDKIIRVWNAQTGDQLAVLESHSEWVTSASFSPDGQQIVSGSEDNTVRVWNAQTGDQLAVLEGHSSPVTFASFSPDGQQIVSSSWDKTVRVWNAQTGDQLAVLEGHSDAVTSASFSPDGQQIVSGSWDKTVRVWNAQTGDQLAVLEGHSVWVTSASFSSDGQQIVSGSDDNTVRVWNAQTGGQLAVPEGHSRTVSSASFSPDGQQIVSGSEDNTVRVWNAQTGDRLAVLEGHSGFVTSASFSPDGQQIVSGSDDNTVRVWNAQTGGQLAVLEGHSRTVTSALFSPDGQQIVSGSDDNTVRVWNAQTCTGGQLAMLEGHSNLVTSASFSPDGQQIVSGSGDNTVRVWNAQTGDQVAVLEGHSNWVSSASFSPDGQQIVSSSWDDTVRVWNAQTGEQLAMLEGHSHWVTSASFSPDGQQIVSGSNDKTVRVWNAQTGDQLALLEGHRGDVTFASFSPDGQHIFSRDSRGNTCAWYLGTSGMESSLGVRGFVFSKADILFQMAIIPAHGTASRPLPVCPSLAYRQLPEADRRYSDRTEDKTWKSFFELDSHTGWISHRSAREGALLRLCWLPPDRRGHAFAHHNSRVVVGASQGAVTIINFCDVLRMLSRTTTV
jgi:WD40 repeat protein